ncbi:MAG: hypothetical protein ABIJ09_17425 [Pseudomonadota bacterium]
MRSDVGKRVMGSDYDRILYENNEPFSSADIVRVEADGSAATWKAIAVAPVTVLEGCPSRAAEASHSEIIFRWSRGSHSAERWRRQWPRRF